MPMSDLGREEHEAVLGVPLHLPVVLLDQQRDQREDPEVGEDDHRDVRLARRSGGGGGL